MNWEYFEALATVLYAKRGFEAYRTPSSKDNGVDVVALPRDESKGKLVQTKSSGTDGALLDWDAVKEVLGGNAFYCQQFPKVAFDLVCMTNQYFDKQAHMNAGLNNIELVEQPGLGEMLKGTPVTLLEVEQVLFTEWTQG
jgi:HJR/Mrr/RecB family endonuclease